MLHDYSPENPYRSVGWRWDRAGDVLEGHAPLSRRRDDAWVQRACRFREALEKCRQPHDYCALADREPGVFWAHQLWSHKDDEFKRVFPYMIESRLLADQPDAAIAEVQGIGPATIQAYHQLFFEVRPRLRRRDWIMANVMGPSVWRGLKARHYDLLWKMFGYFCGEHVLDALIYTFVEPARPEGPGGVQAAFVDDLKTQVGLRALVAARTMTISDFNATMIIEQYTKMVEVERKAVGVGGAQASILANVQVMMRSLPFAVGTHPSGRTEVIGLDEYDAMAAELRGDELMGLSAGVEPPDAARMGEIRYPEPRKPAALPASAHVPA